MPDFLTQFDETLDIQVLTQNINVEERWRGTFFIVNGNITITVRSGMKPGWIARFFIKSGSVTFVQGAGTTLNTADSSLIYSSQYSTVALFSYEGNVWITQNTTLGNFSQVTRRRYNNIVQVTNTQDGVWETGHSHTILANQLANNGDTLKFTFIGTFTVGDGITVANVRFSLGALVLFTSPNANTTKGWKFELVMIRQSSTIIAFSYEYSESGKTMAHGLSSFNSAISNIMKSEHMVETFPPLGVGEIVSTEASFGDYTPKV